MLGVKYADLQRDRDVNTPECTSISGGVEGRICVWLTGGESGHWERNVQRKRRKGKRERERERERERLWMIDCTCWAIRVRLIGWLSLHWTVISWGAPLWKPFKCELIDVIVLKMTELLWYYRTHFAFSPLWINNELNGNWQNVAFQKRGDSSERGRWRAAERKGKWEEETILSVCACVCVCVQVRTAWSWGHGNLTACVFWPVD